MYTYYFSTHGTCRLGLDDLSLVPGSVDFSLNFGGPPELPFKKACILQFESEKKV